ncbi:NAD(P)/FAD-dependent oxidoreductase [Nocardia aurea]|uniref:FAD-dependent oxidoreductase n=1 Tax=Nocardia aurea TaxID=2144174 RepID=A0ABV3FVN4_9NOCA
MTDVLVVGASAAGLTTVEALRRNGFGGRITLLGAESHPPYDRPPLSKQILSGAWTPERTTLRAPEILSALDVELILGDPARELDAANRTVRTATRTITADHIVVATGARPRTMPVTAGTRGPHVLRTLDDALALRAGLLAGSRLIVVGEGVLGAEIAATAREMGLDVTMTGPQPAPMAAQLGELASGLLAELHTERGVRLRLGLGVTRLVEDDGAVTGVELASGQTLSADLVVVAIGAVPATEWLEGSGLRLDNGVVCDAECRAAENIYAVGDVARWQHAGYGGPIRLENRTNATEQAMVVAANIVGTPREYRPVPYFWTDQFQAKIQVHGVIAADAHATVVEGDPADGRFVARYERDGVVTGVLGWNMPKQCRAHRQHVVDALAVDALEDPVTAQRTAS